MRWQQTSTHDGLIADPWGLTLHFYRVKVTFGANSPGTFGHGGLYGTQAWIDMKRSVALIMMIQRSDFKNADESPARWAFQKAALE